MKQLIQKAFQWLNIPGFVQPISLWNENVGRIKIETSQYYTILTVGGTEYFFERVSGKYDGWGGMVISGCKEDCTQQSTPSHD